MTHTAPALEALPTAPVSRVKKEGWRALMEVVAKGPLVMMNHARPEAVILPVATYEAMVAALGATRAKDEEALSALRRRFDARLAPLQEAEAGEALRRMMRSPAVLGGQVKAGSF